jgi:hypothetical protein
MKKPSFIISVLLVVFHLSAITLAQVKNQGSPFDKYRQSTVNGLDFCKLQFQVGSMRLSLQPTPLPNGFGIPHIVGETSSGKLLIEVDVYGSDLPQTIEARKDAMMEAVSRSMAGFSFAIQRPESGLLTDANFNKWCVIQFSDTEKILKAKGNKPFDPSIGIYENGELVLR